MPVLSENVSISSYYLACLRIPHYQLLVAVLAGVELVDVSLLTCTTTCCAKGNLAQSANLAHDIRSIVCRYDVYLVMALISHAELLIVCQFRPQEFF